jgi:hypothetical protein
MDSIIASMRAAQAETAALRFIRREIRRDRPVRRLAIAAFLTRNYPLVELEPLITRLMERFR